ncbi:type II toxin-antitoxin system RelE family toxin [Thalassobacter stenotrophicus]|uniref:type II toxin-antitoxin system RelE family toxin n=1 Tax=Thalassobacter stenotrophicus TaxID=266809 RepID=UPI000D5C9928|nr:type II toxin-antitoxin system RelE/ParE family toxin [Thalassobacter stenotrophicus]PVZ49690.1 hypothetical protein DD557_13670 [Thalassobacter stenotrophicus]
MKRVFARQRQVCKYFYAIAQFNIEFFALISKRYICKIRLEMAVIYTNAARKGLKKMPAKDRAAIMAKLDSFAATGRGDVKPLAGSKLHRMRHGDWRAVFEIEDGILVVQVAHRREVYK